MEPFEAREGQVLMRDDDSDEWEWRDPPRERRVIEWVLVAVSLVIFAAILAWDMW